MSRPRHRHVGGVVRHPLAAPPPNPADHALAGLIAGPAGGAFPMVDDGWRRVPSVAWVVGLTELSFELEAGIGVSVRVRR